MAHLSNRLNIQSWKAAILLLIIPAVTFAVMYSTLLNNRNVYMFGGDPMYAYLLNSLTLAQGEFDIGHTDNPGTTVQVFGAVVLRLVYLFRSADTIQNDVIANPEFYLFICRFAQLILISALLFILGKVVVKSHNGGVATALIMQSSILSGIFILMQSASFAPEGLLIAGGIALLILCWKYLDRVDYGSEVSTKYILGFGVLCGFITVTKLPALVCIAIPLVTLKEMRAKLVFLISFIVSSAFFLIPIYNRLESLFGFVGGLLTHTGTYGTGKEGFVDTSTLLPNLKAHFIMDTFFFLVLFVALLTTLFSFLRNYKEKKIWSAEQRMVLGIALAMLGNLFIATKHFGWHYMIPAQLLLIFTSVLVFRIWRELIPAFVIRQSKTILTIIAILLPATFFARFYVNYYYNPGLRQIRYEAQKVINKYPDAARIYIGNFPAAATPEPAMYFGWAYCGNIRAQYSELIQQNYPDAFMYNPHSRDLHGFGLRTSMSLLMIEHPQIVLYSTDSDTTMLKAIIAEWSAASDSNGIFVNINRVYSSSESSESIYLMQIDTARSRNKFRRTRVMTCSFDEIVSDSLFATSDSSVFVNRFQFVPTQTSLSGKGALYTNKCNSTGSVVRFPVIPGAQYVVTLWRRGEGYNSWINLTDGTSSVLFQSGAFVTGNTKEGWKEIKMNLFVPDDYPLQTVQLMFTNEQNLPLWIDDLKIEEYAPYAH